MRLSSPANANFVTQAQAMSVLETQDEAAGNEKLCDDQQEKKKV